MINELKSKLKALIGQKKKGGETKEDDDLFKELGIDDDSLLSGDDSISDPEIFLEDSEDKKRKEKSLLSLSYLVLGLSLIISIAGSTILIMSFNNQEKIRNEINDEKVVLSTQITKLQESINEDGDISTKAKKVDPDSFYEQLYENRYQVSFFTEQLFEVVSKIKSVHSIYISPIKYDIDTKNNSFNLLGETNSYTNLAKIINILNDSDIISGILLQGGAKTISADGTPVVPIAAQGKIEIVKEEIAPEST